MTENMTRYLSLVKEHNVTPVHLGGETTNKLEGKLNERIKILSSYYGSIGNNQYGEHLDAEIGKDVRCGDMMLMVVASHKGTSLLPIEFREIIKAGNRNMNVKVGYRIFNDADADFYRVNKNAKKFFVNLFTIRGTRYIIDAKARVDSLCSIRGRTTTPRVATADQGAIISIFAFDNAHDLKINHDSITSIANGDTSLNIGIESSDMGMSDRKKADFAKSVKRGNDVALALSIY